MAYCRWLDCDLYVYGAEKHFVIHVACRGLPEDGKTMIVETASECVGKMLHLRSIGYDVSETAIRELRLEAAQDSEPGSAHRLVASLISLADLVSVEHGAVLLAAADEINKNQAEIAKLKEADHDPTG